MRSSSVSSSDNATAEQYNNLRSDAYGGSLLLVHQQDTPGMTVYVEPGTLYIGPTQVTYAGGSSPTITAPTAHPRIDLLTIDSSGTLALVTGTEASSPTAPTYPVTSMVLAEIYNVVGETLIYDNANQTSGQGYITDVRPVLTNPAPSVITTSNQKSTVYQNTSGRYELHMVCFGMTGGNSSAIGLAQVTINCDSSSAPATEVAYADIQSISPSTNETACAVQLVFMVPPNYYYEFVPYTSGSATVGSIVVWNKITF